jgi:surface antigen
LDRVGDAASSVTRRIGRFVGASERSVERVLRIGRSLSDAIASRLDCDEQEQAAAATEAALQGGVGTTVTWTSETREGVSGSSTIVAAETARRTAIA